MRAALFGLAAFVVWGGAPPANAAFDSIRARGMLHCGGVARPGLAMRDDRGGWSGAEVDMCRAVADAVLGRESRFDFHAYEAGGFDRARTGDDDLSFVTSAEIAQQKLGGRLRIGRPVFVEEQALMVAKGSPYRRPADLAGHAICFLIATASDNALEAWAVTHKIAFVPNAFQEPDEMADAYNVQRCQAVVGDAGDLAAIRRDGGINHLKSRLLPEALATVRIFAATPRRRDPRWGDFVARTLASPLVTEGRPRRFP